MSCHSLSLGQPRNNKRVQPRQAAPLSSHTSLIWQHLPMPPTPSGPWHVSRTDPPCVALRGTLNVYLHTQTKHRDAKPAKRCRSRRAGAHGAVSFTTR